MLEPLLELWKLPIAKSIVLSLVILLGAVLWSKVADDRWNPLCSLLILATFIALVVALVTRETHDGERPDDVPIISFVVGIVVVVVLIAVVVVSPYLIEWLGW